VLDTKNGKPAIHQSFSQRLELQMSGLLPTEFWTINYVAGMDGTINNRILSGALTSPTSENWLLGWWSNSERSVYFEGTGTYLSGVPATTATQSYTAIGQGSGGLARLYRNGIDFTAEGSAITKKPNQILVTNGYNPQQVPSPPSEGSNCIIQELLIYNYAFADSQLIKINNYQKAFYGIN
jgi:hypothetical protein